MVFIIIVIHLVVVIFSFDHDDNKSHSEAGDHEEMEYAQDHFVCLWLKQNVNNKWPLLYQTGGHGVILILRKTKKNEKIQI